ncbi:LysR family transcriptional regulator [Tundrisphaera lichenicola]|uniref:LysR family transcriptional regulator n=1 Tax=Tundrisphaera lichenicola TaxID=2029860 RepID=UPI003EBAC833
MEIHQLRYFVKVAELGSFTRAAEACFGSQPSLSQQIIKLEGELGRPLFELLGRRVLLTEAGRRLGPMGDQVLRLVDDAKSLVEEDPEAGRLVVGAPPTVVPYFLTQVVGTFASRFPRAQVELVEEVTSSIVKKLVDCEIDLAVLPLPIEGHDFDVEPLFEEELLVLLPDDHRLVAAEVVTLADLQAEPFILLNDAHCLAGNALGFCQQKRFRPIVTGRVNQLATIQELVSVGQGVSLVPKMARKADRDPRRVYRHLAGDRPRRTIGLVLLPDRRQGPLTSRFSAVIRDAGISAGEARCFGTSSSTKARAPRANRIRVRYRVWEPGACSWSREASSRPMLASTFFGKCVHEAIDRRIL